MIVFTYSCGGGGGGGDSSETGSVSFSLTLQDPGTIRALSKQTSDSRAVQFECQTADFVIVTIEAQVRDENGEIIAEGEPIDCEVGQGRLEEIEPGANYTVFIFARNSEGVIIFEGHSDPFTVVAGEVTDAGLISLTPVDARLEGEFSGTGFGFDDYFSTWTGLFETDFDGSGGGSFNDLTTSDGFLENGTLTYNLDFDGSLTSTLSDGTVFDGILNNDNNILAVADTNFTDQFIEFDVVIKKSTGLSNAILNGEYIGVRIGSFPSTVLTTVTFDGAGNGEFQFLAASNGDLDNGKFTYSVGSDGDVTIEGVATGDLDSEGIVSGDGTVVALVDTGFRGGNEDIDMTVLIKKGSGLSDATIDGDYVAVSYASFTGDGFDEQTTITSISADGVGNMQFEILSNSSDEFGTFETTYTVDSDGRIRIELPGTEFFDGIVSSNGEIFTFVNTDITDDFIEMGVAIRKTQ